MLRNYYSLSEKRKRQIDTLKIFNDHVIELKENSEYRVEFIAGNKNMSLDVILGPEFPNEKPVLLISPLIVHPWVLENKILSAPGLLNYTIHSDLGRVVHAIIREFERNPPAIHCTNNSDGSTFSNMSQPLAGQDTPNSLFLSPLPSVASSNLHNTTPQQFPQLSDLSAEELHSILENVDLQDEFLKTLPESITYEKVIEELQVQVEALANENLSKRNILEDLKTSITDQVSSAMKLDSRINQLNIKLKEKSEPYKLHRIKELLNSSAAIVDEEAETIIAEFLSGSMPADIFVARYTEKRGLCHSKRAKYDRMAYMMKLNLL